MEAHANIAAVMKHHDNSVGVKESNNSKQPVIQSNSV